MANNRKPKLAVWKFASCDGCQLSLLDCEDELLALSEVIDFANFPEASRDIRPGPYDLSLVEGSVTTPHDAERIQEVRKKSRYLVTIGACATAGGIQSLRNFSNVSEYIKAVYASPDYISTLATSTPISAHIKVDYELQGCPPNKHQLVHVIKSFLAGKKPNIPNESVCVECKKKGNVCVLVASGTPCLGPVTHAGCGALCPSYNRGCYSCYGPKEHANVDTLSNWLKEERGMKAADVGRSLRSIYAAKDEFRKVSEKNLQDDVWPTKTK